MFLLTTGDYVCEFNNFHQAFFKSTSLDMPFFALLFFFLTAGEHYYKYNSSNDTVEKGWPKLISEGFGPKPGTTVGIPSNLDSVFFDKRDVYIYFFKGNDVSYFLLLKTGIALRSRWNYYTFSYLSCIKAQYFKLQIYLVSPVRMTLTKNVNSFR